MNFLLLPVPPKIFFKITCSRELILYLQVFIYNIIYIYIKGRIYFKKSSLLARRTKSVVVFQDRSTAYLLSPFFPPFFPRETLVNGIAMFLHYVAIYRPDCIIARKTRRATLNIVIHFTHRLYVQQTVFLIDGNCNIDL